jgi:hypothetical protein
MKINGKYEGIIEIIEFHPKNKSLRTPIFEQYYSSMKIKHVNDYSFYNTSHLFYDESITNSAEWVLDIDTNALYKYDDNTKLYYNTNNDGTGFRLISKN